MEKLTSAQKEDLEKVMKAAKETKKGDLSKAEKNTILSTFLATLTKVDDEETKAEGVVDLGTGTPTAQVIGAPVILPDSRVTIDDSSSIMAVDNASTLKGALIAMYKAGLKGLTLKEGGTMNSEKHRRAIKGMIKGLKVSEISKEIAILLLCACNNKDRVVNWLKTESFQGINTAEVLIVLAAIPRKEKRKTGTTFDVQVPSAFPHYAAFTTVLMMVDTLDAMRMTKFLNNVTPSEKEMLVRMFLNNRHVGQLDLTEDMQSINEGMTTNIWKEINEHKKGEEGFDSKKNLYRMTVAKDKYPLIDINSGSIITGPYNQDKLVEWIWETAAFLSRD